MSVANELIVRGWHQGGFFSPDGAVCLAGAVIAAYRHSYAEEYAALDVIASVAGLARRYDIATWNDDPIRTFDEVLRVAKEADELLEGTL